jgi:hypothetical protein
VGDLLATVVRRVGRGWTAAARRRRAGRMGAGVGAGGGVPGAWGGWRRPSLRKWKERRKGEEKRAAGRNISLLCRVPAIWHSTKIFLKI